MDARLEIENSLKTSPLKPALIWAWDIEPPFQNKEYPPFLRKAVDKVRDQGENAWPQNRRSLVRDMLRYGHYKPSGRSKPASEFLLGAALRDEMPSLCTPVDINNAISLETGIPGSIFDADKTGKDLLLGRGKEGETYVFNSSGQIISLYDLLCVYCKQDGQWQACGNPVKDSMTTKINDHTRNIIAILYAPWAIDNDEIEAYACSYAQFLKIHCKAQNVGFQVYKVNENENENKIST